MSEVYDRPSFIRDWAQQLECNPTEYDVAAHLINKNRNFETAMAVVFGLKWTVHEEYLRNAAKYLREQWQDGDIATVEWLDAFVQHYISEVAAYPSDA